MLWGILLLCALVLTEGSWQAEQLFHEVYGQKLAAAKTPQAKTALAKELLQLAKKETDTEAKRIELQTARRLAIEAESAALAVEIVRAWVEAFPEAQTDAQSLLDRAELLWKEAETKRGTERLAWQVDAIEMWLSADTESQLVTKRWERRISDTLIEPLRLQEPYPVAVSRTLARMTTVPVMIINATSGYSMNVATESRDPGGMVMQFPLQKDKILPSSRWVIQPIDENTFVFRNYHSGLVLTWKENVPHLVQDVWQNGQNQHWQIVPTKNFCFIIRNMANPLCVAPPADRITEGVALGLYSPSATGGIFWKIVPALR